MPYGLYLSAAGANAQSHRLEVLSHNLANINTAGFKPHMAMLQSRHAQAIEQGDVTAGNGTIDDIGGGISIKPAQTQFQQGVIQTTGNRTDFVFDNQGKLVTPGGDEVRSAGGGTIRINPSLPYEIMDDGAVVQGGERQMLRLVRPREVGDLSRVGENLFESLTSVNDTPADQRSVVSGALESSGVEPTGAMMELIEASRVYEANVRMIQTQDEAMGQLIGRVLRQG